MLSLNYIRENFNNKKKTSVLVNFTTGKELTDIIGSGDAKLIFSKSAYPTEVIDEARFRAGLGWLEWALYGIENRDDEMLLAHIGQSARDISPVGSGW